MTTTPGLAAAIGLLAQEATREAAAEYIDHADALSEAGRHVCPTIGCRKAEHDLTDPHTTRTIRADRWRVTGNKADPEPWDIDATTDDALTPAEALEFAAALADVAAELELLNDAR